jgi:hypothetical protein
MSKDHQNCDRCGAMLPGSRGVRYEVRMEVKAAYDPLSLNADDLSKDYRPEIEAVLRAMSGLAEEEAQNQVYRVFEFDLCVACQRRWIANPLH